MDFANTPRGSDYLKRVKAFMAEHIEPMEADYLRELKALDDSWVVLPVIRELKAKAREAGLWNLFLPDAEHGAGLTNAEYAPLAEAMGT